MSEKHLEDLLPPPGSAYYNWALGPGSDAYYIGSGKNALLPVLIELKGISIEDFASGETLFTSSKTIETWQTIVTVAPLFTENAEHLKGLNFVVALVTEKFFAWLNKPMSKELRKAVHIVNLGPPMRDGRRDHDVANGDDRRDDLPSSSNATGTGNGGSALARDGTHPVIVGIIDDGIAYANERFRNGNRSRMEFLWLQDAILPIDAVLPLDAVLPIPYLSFGRELRANGGFVENDININLEASTHGGIVDEDEVYRSMHVLDFAQPNHQSLGFSATHGMAVMDIATGYPAADRRDDRPIIGVQLPTSEVKDTSLSGLAPHIFLGVLYILFRAYDVAASYRVERLPIVINLSFGNIAGPHDGTSLLERGIEALIGRWRALGWEVEIVLPSGNSRQAQCHAQLRFEMSPVLQRLPWQVIPDDKTASYLQIWLPYRSEPPFRSESPVRSEFTAEDRVRVRVVAPGGNTANATDWLGEASGGEEDYPPAPAVPLCRVTYTLVPLPTGRGVFEIFLQPTAAYDTNAGGPPAPTAPSGVWTVEIENRTLLPFETVEVWIQRDDTPFTYAPLGRQSYFDAECYERFDFGGQVIETDDPTCFVKRAGTINAIATGGDPVVLGGVVRKERRPAVYSAGGPVTRPAQQPLTREGPDALAVSDDSIVHTGVLASGTRSGSTFAFAGTSIAAPRLTRWMASELAQEKPAGRNAVANLAAAEEALLPLDPPKPSLQRGGAGRIILPPVHPIARFWPWPK
jgi:hypothetical protein